MKHKRIPFVAARYIVDDNLNFYYDPDGGSCFGSHPSPMWILRGINVERLLKALSIKNVSNLQCALERLPEAENDIIRLKNFCDEHNIEYVFEKEE